MDYDKHKALIVAATYARTQEMLTSEALARAAAVRDLAASDWKAANEQYQSAKKVLDAFIEESIKTDAKAEVGEYMVCP